MDALIVDDETFVREIVTEGLTDEGLEVVEARSTKQALALAETAGGQGMDGLALAEEVHRRWPDTGVVIMTGNSAGVQAHTLGEQDRFLTKPFGNARLITAVRELIGCSTR